MPISIPELVEEFLVQADVPVHIRREINAGSFQEDIGSLITFRCARYYAKVFMDPALRPLVVEVFRRFLEEPRFSDWLGFLSMSAARLVSGDNVNRGGTTR